MSARGDDEVKKECVETLLWHRACEVVLYQNIHRRAFTGAAG
jgi:hypothetical protein